MIKYNIEKTKELFGYSPLDLVESSGKKVYLYCFDCDVELLRRRADLSDEHRCKLCKFTQIRKSVDMEKVKASRKKTMLEKYGVENAAQIPESHEKRKKTCLEKYGVEHHLQNKEIFGKQLLSNLLKFGSNYFFATIQGKEAVVSGNLKKYGVTNPMLAEEVKQRLAANNTIKFGAANVFELPEFQEKAKTAKLEKYGTLAPINLGKTEEKIREKLKELFGISLVRDIEVLNGLEIDMYCTDLKIGIEYCGLYWHCEKFVKSRTKHRNKFKAAKEKGVRLFTIYENEWLHKQSQVLSYLRAALGKNSRRIYARQCTVKEINSCIAKEFIELYHIQGKNQLGKFFAGLYYRDELLAVMSFGRHHRTTGRLVLDRLCFKHDTTIVGGASKLFKFLLALSGCAEIISWSDNRWSLGNVYASLGFKKAAELPEDYSYVDTKKHRLLSKQSQKKSNTKCPPDKTEKEWCESRELYRIWDCGKIRWEYKQQ